MIDKKQLDDELTRYLNNIIEVRNNFALYKLIKLEDTIKTVNKYSHIFLIVVNSLENSFLVQLYKLLDKDEQKNLFRMIDLCKNNIKYFENQKKLKTKLKDLELYLNLNKDIIKSIINIRHKFIAHSDRKYFKSPQKVFEENDIKNNELENLIENLYKFVKSIYSNLQPIMIIDWTDKMKKEWENIIEKV